MAKHLIRITGELGALVGASDPVDTHILTIAVVALVMSLTGMAIENTALERAGQYLGVVIFLVATFKLVMA